MATGSLKVKVRPLRLAFLVPPKDETAIRMAIETSSFLWGGAFNPILPVLPRLPKGSKRIGGTATTAQAMLEGYLDTFDPDFVVKVGALESADLKFGDRDIIKCSEIVEGIKDDGTPGFGQCVAYHLTIEQAADSLERLARSPLDA